MGENKDVQPKEIKPKTEQELAQEFVDAYNILCRTYNFQVVTTPAWRFSGETGDWRMVLQQSVGRVAQNKENN